MRFGKSIFLAVLITVFCVCAATAGDMNLKGWEKGGEYDSLYDNSERDAFKGKVKDIIDLNMDGMAKGVALVVKDKTDGEDVVVHLGPADFVTPRIQAVRKGDTVKVYGCWAEIDGKDIFMAAKIKTKGEGKLKMRLTKDGSPFWSLSPEELKQEEPNE